MFPSAILKTLYIKYPFKNDDVHQKQNSQDLNYDLFLHMPCLCGWKKVYMVKAPRNTFVSLNCFSFKKPIFIRGVPNLEENTKQMFVLPILKQRSFVIANFDLWTFERAHDVSHLLLNFWGLISNLSILQLVYLRLPKL